LRLKAAIAFVACLLTLPVTASAQLPSPTYGWNLGNTMEAPSGVGTWSPAPAQSLINAAADAGFNTIRIPCAWDSHANQTTHQIDPTYMAQVKQVVDWCFARNLYVVINAHWDGGWLENNVTDTVNSTINTKMSSYWTQIANTFASYDSHLLFAGANEPAVSTAAQMSTLTTYYNTFISAVRATRGNNSSRWLVVQGPSTDVDKTDSLMNTMPSDPTPGKLMVEVHYYGPYQYALMTADANWGNMFYFWGAAYHSTTLTARNPTWGEEAYVDSEFQKMTSKFTSKGIPVLLGEFAAIRRTSYSDLTGANLSLHLASRTYFDKYIVTSANSHGLRPVYWDDGGLNNNSMGLFNRSTNTLSDSDSAHALTGGAALPPPGGDAAQYSFESGVQGWVSGGAPISGVAISTTQKFAGNQSLKVSFSGGAATSTVSIGSPSTAAGKTVTFHVWIPSGSKIGSIQPYVMDHNWAWTGNYKTIGNLTTNAWNTITVVVPSNAAMPLQQMGIQFTTSANWNGACYVDSIGW